MGSREPVSKNTYTVWEVEVHLYIQYHPLLLRGFGELHFEISSFPTAPPPPRRSPPHVDAAVSNA